MDMACQKMKLLHLLPALLLTSVAGWTTVTSLSRPKSTVLYGRAAAVRANTKGKVRHPEVGVSSFHFNPLITFY